MCEHLSSISLVSSETFSPKCTMYFNLVNIVTYSSINLTFCFTLYLQQTVCGCDLLRTHGKSYVCDVNGFSFVKTSKKYYDDAAQVLVGLVVQELAPQLYKPYNLDVQEEIPAVEALEGTMLELRCVVGVIRHGDRTPKQKMKMEVRHPR